MYVRLTATQAVKATALLLSLPEYQNAHTIAIFMSMPASEINTRELITQALKSGKQVFIPYIYKHVNTENKDLPASIMDMLLLSSEEDMATLKPDKWGIPSIPRSSVNERVNAFGGRGRSEGCAPKSDAPGLHVIVMPSMALDEELNRLGHGKGYYDNFLTRYTCSSSGRRKPFLGMLFSTIAFSLPPLPFKRLPPCS